MTSDKSKNFILFIPFLVFILIFIIGISLPLNLTPHYGNYTSRNWNWVEIVIALIASYYIIRSKTFNLKQLMIAILLGTTCLVAMFRDPRHIDIIVTGICVAVTFYGACRIFEQTNVNNSSTGIGIIGSLKYFALGAVVSIPLALLNVLYFSLQGEVNFVNFLSSTVFALKPAIAEEVVFRYFLLALSYHLLKETEIGFFSSLLIYILLIVPHQLLHYTDMLLASPPMAIAMKQKNLQMAMGMHQFSGLQNLWDTLNIRIFFIQFQHLIIASKTCASTCF